MMDWTYIFAMILGNASFIVPLFLWTRSESRADYRHLEAAVNSQLNGIREEMKDFHGRLCALEEKYLKQMTRSSD